MDSEGGQTRFSIINLKGNPCVCRQWNAPTLE